MSCRAAFAALLALTLAACVRGEARQRSAPLGEAARVAAVVDPLIAAELERSRIPGAAVVLVRAGRIVHSKGYGVSDLAAATPADPERTIWPVASITKLVTAIAAMQLVERKRVWLDGDVNRALRRLRVPAQGYGPLTLRHLLSHTGGLDELPGRRFDGAAPPDLAAFLRDRLLRYRAPGYRTAYSTYGIALAGLLIEDVSGAAYADYVRANIFVPAGMATARIVARRGDEHGLATPYAVEDGRASPIEHEFYATPPASSMAASAADMGRLLISLTRPSGRPILRPATLREMVRQQVTIHPALPGWGLGFQLDEANGVRIAEHGGDIAGFSSLLVLLPDEEAGFFIVHHGEGGDLRFRVREALLDALHPARPREVPPADPADAERLGEYAGRYLSSLACRSCPGAADDAFTLTVDPEGSLLFWGRKWRPIGRDLFVSEDGRRLLGFSRDEAGRIDSVSGGSWRVADRIDPRPSPAPPRSPSSAGSR